MSFNFKDFKAKFGIITPVVGEKFVSETCKYVAEMDRELKAYRMALKSAEAKLNYYRNR